MVRRTETLTPATVNPLIHLMRVNQINASHPYVSNGSNAPAHNTLLNPYILEIYSQM